MFFQYRILALCSILTVPFFAALYANDSLLQQLELAETNEQQSVILQQLATVYEQENLNTAKAFARQNLELVKIDGSALNLMEAQMLLGRIFLKQAQYDSARVFFQAVYSTAQEMNLPAQQANSLLKMAEVQGHQVDYDQANKSFFEALDIYESLNDEAGIARSYNGIADLLYMQNDYEQSIRYCERAIAILEKLNYPGELAETYKNMGYDYLILGDYDRALECVNKAISLHQSADSSPLELSSSYNARGNVYKYMKRYDEAIADYENNLALCKIANHPRGIMVSHANLGHVYKEQKEFVKALPHTLKAIEMMNEHNYLRNLWENYMHASDIYAGLGNYQKANEYTWAYADEIERLYEEEISQLEGELTSKYESGQREAALILQQRQLDQQQKIQWLSFGLLALLLVLLGLVIWGFRNKQKTNRLLELSNSQLEKKNAENELLLKEIHHRVKNNLQVISSLLSLQSAEIEDPNVLDAMMESQNRVRSMALIHQKLYQGENLAAIEMRDYLETLGETMLDAFGENADQVTIDYLMDEMELDVDTAIPIGLIVNELLTNALKYAFPEKRTGIINISLQRDKNGEFELRVADNGIGVQSDRSAAGSGSTNFGSRLVQLLTTQLDGSIRQESREGMVTEIRFKAYGSAA